MPSLGRSHSPKADLEVCLHSGTAQGLMTSASDSAWLIPVLTACWGQRLIGPQPNKLNRTIQQVSATVAVFLIRCVGAAAVLSYAVLIEQIGGAPPTEVLFDWARPAASILQMGLRVDALCAVDAGCLVNHHRRGW